MSEWREAALSDVAEISLSNVDKKIFPNEIDVLLCNYMDVYANRYIDSKLNFSPGSVNKQELDKFRLNEKDVIITKDSETADDIAVPAVVTENVDSLVCGYHLAILRPHSDQLDGLFLMNLFQIPELKNQFSNYANGITRYGLTKDAIYNIRLRFPTSLPEQRKIAKILSTIDAVIEKTEHAIDKYKAIKQGMMHDLFTRGLDENGKLRPRYEDAPHLYKKTELGWLPKEWEVDVISNICDIINGGTPSTNIAEYWDGEIPWLSVEDFNIGERYVFKSQKTITEMGLKNSATVILPKGSLIISARGTVGVLSQLGCNMAFNQSNYGLISFTEQCDNDYLYYFLKNHLAKFSQATFGSVFATITRKTFNDIFVACPTDKKEKDNVVEKLTLMDVIIENEKIVLSKYSHLKTALMQDLLTGRKRVRAEDA